MATVADLVRLQRQAIISGRVGVPSISRVIPESARQAASKAIASQAIYGGGLSQRINDVSVSARAMQPPSLGALERERMKPCPTGYQRDARGECVIVIETSTVANAIPAEYRFGPTLSQFRPVLDFNGAVPGQSTTESLRTIKRNLGRAAVGLNGLRSSMRRGGLSGLGVTALSVTSPSLTTSGSTLTLTTQQVIDALNAQIAALTSQVTKLQSDYEKLNSACEASSSALSSCNAALADVRGRLDAANAEIARLNLIIANMSRDLSMSQMNIDSLNGKIADLKAALDAAAAQINAARDTIDGLRSQLAAANGDVASLRQQLDAMRAERDALAAAASAATAQLASANSAVAALKAVCSTLSAPAAVSLRGLRGLGETLDPSSYAECLKLAEKIKADLDSKAGFIDPKDCPRPEACPPCAASETPNWLPLAVVGVSAAKLFL